jgi:hypothetical protein
MKVVHLETRIVTLLGIMDEDGDISQKIVVQANPQDPQDPLVLGKLSLPAFEAAFNTLKRIRAEVEAKLAAQVVQDGPLPLEDLIPAEEN